MDSRVYRRLAAAKRESESFSKAIARLLDHAESAHAASDILAGARRISPLGVEDAEVMRGVVQENRSEAWVRRDLPGPSSTARRW